MIIYLFLPYEEILIPKDVTLNAFKYVLHTVFILSVLLPVKGWRKEGLPATSRKFAHSCPMRKRCPYDIFIPPTK